MAVHLPGDPAGAALSASLCRIINSVVTYSMVKSLTFVSLSGPERHRAEPSDGQDAPPDRSIRWSEHKIEQGIVVN